MTFEEETAGRDPNLTTSPTKEGLPSRENHKDDEGIVQNLYYHRSKDFLEAGKKRPPHPRSRFF